jgi:alkanesulfonate monooxygenase SsuD/methylene tetrahydromethanopterin reductase-like flavin-dependent oxidoreductase (luciferase family)
MRQTGQPEAEVRSPYSGSPEQVAERIEQLLALGIDYLILQVPNAFEAGAVRRIGTDLLPLLTA